MKKPANILKNAIQNLTVFNVCTTKNISDMKRNIYNSKRKVLPKCPISLNEVHTMLSAKDITTHTEELFIFPNNADKNKIIFSCKSNIDFYYAKVKQYILIKHQAKAF